MTFGFTQVQLKKAYTKLGMSQVGRSCGLASATPSTGHQQSKTSTPSDYVSKKIKKEENFDNNAGSSNSHASIHSSSNEHQSSGRATQQAVIHNPMHGPASAHPNPYQVSYGPGTAPNGLTSSGIDPVGPLPNEIFELLNEFWRPNEMLSPETQYLSGKFERRSPDGSQDGVDEGEKEGDDDITSLNDTEVGIDRGTQKRRYSRLSDGYERLKAVLPSVKDKRRVSKARILDEAINYIQRLESITNVLKREHEKRLSMLNGASGYFPDYPVQPYMRSLFPKQVYPPGMIQKTGAASSQYPKMSTTPKSPRMKQYSQNYSAPGHLGGSQMASDYNYNSIGSYNSSAPGMYGSADASQMLNGDVSPITHTPPYSACSLSPGTPTTAYQNGASTVNNSWPYQGCSVNGYGDVSSSNPSSYSGSRPAQNYGNSGYGSLQTGLWSNMAISDVSSQVVPHGDHSMKVG